MKEENKDIIEAEEKKRIEQENAHTEKKSYKLIPVLRFKAERHQSRIDTLAEKIAARQVKISNNQAKIEKLTARAARLEDRNAMLRNAFGNLPLVKKIIASNEEKIKDIRENKIPKRKEKAEKHKQKLEILSKKQQTAIHKLDRVIALSDTIKSFSLSSDKERRAVFTEALDRLNSSNISCLNDKKTLLLDCKSKLVDEYNSPDTSVLDKVNLQSSISGIDEKIQNIEKRLAKIEIKQLPVPEKVSDAEVDNAIAASEAVTEEAVESDKLSVSKLSAAIAFAEEMPSTEKQIDVHKSLGFRSPENINPDTYTPPSNHFSRAAQKNYVQAASDRSAIKVPEKKQDKGLEI